MNSALLVDELLERRTRFVVQIQFERLTRPHLIFFFFGHNIVAWMVDLLQHFSLATALLAHGSAWVNTQSNLESASQHMLAAESELI